MRRILRIFALVVVLAIVLGGIAWKMGMLPEGLLTPVVHAPGDETIAVTPTTEDKGAAPPTPRAEGTAGGTLEAKGPEGPVMPFAVGERLEFRVRWATFLNSARVEMRVDERREFYGREAWHLRTTARTLDPVRLIFQMDDQFDSYIDRSTLETLQYEMHLDEQGKKETRILRLNPAGKKPWTNQATVQVPEGTRDPVGFLYYMRSVDWEKESTLRAPVYDGRKIYEVEVRREGMGETVRVAGGSFPTIRLSAKVFDRGTEVAGTRFVVWLARDGKKTPVQIEAEVPFGSLKVELVRRN